MLADIHRAVFSVLGVDDQGGIHRGTAFTIGPDLLITCEHVIRGVTIFRIVSEEPIFDGRNNTRAEVVTRDDVRDLALLKGVIPAPQVLEISTAQKVDDATPLLVWTWPGWGKRGSSSVRPEESIMRSVQRAAVVTCWWPAKERSVPSFSFAGHVEEGMSGGPIVSALTGEVVGVVTAAWNIDPTEVAENWRDNVQGIGRYTFSEFLGATPDQVVEAQLMLGMGMALPAQELRDFIETSLH